ncbi:uncharacterized protein TNCV_3310871 [Trichonephila clavipes]|nr:uncharacterized protein TNCV_3310871 [Trichonephila clavipes]
MELNQGRSYYGISRINDKGPPSYKGHNMCNYSLTNRAFIPKIFDEDIRSSESDCEESEESADVIDNTPVNPVIYVARDGTECIPHNCNVPGRFATRNVLRQSSGGSTSFAKHNVNDNFL